MKDKARREQTVEKAAECGILIRSRSAHCIRTLTFILSLTGRGEEQNKKTATNQ